MSNNDRELRNRISQLERAVRGGKAGEVLTKLTDRSYKTVWGPGGGAGGPVDWSSIVNKPATFPPSSHTHTLSEITDSGSMAAVNDAPANGLQYARKDNAWHEVQSASGGIGDAPNDGQDYVRQSQGWVVANYFSGAWGDISGKPTFATVATTGDYNDLSNKPTIINYWTPKNGDPDTVINTNSNNVEVADALTVVGAVTLSGLSYPSVQAYNLMIGPDGTVGVGDVSPVFWQGAPGVPGGITNTNAGPVLANGDWTFDGGDLFFLPAFGDDSLLSVQAATGKLVYRSIPDIYWEPVTGGIANTNPDTVYINGTEFLSNGTVLTANDLSVSNNLLVTDAFTVQSLAAGGPNRMVTVNPGGGFEAQAIPTPGVSLWKPSGNDIYNTNSGNVGIGTTNPLEKVHAFGAAPIALVQDSSTGLAAANPRLRLAESGAGQVVDNYWDIGPNIDSPGANFALQMAYNEVRRFEVRSDGNAWLFGNLDLTTLTATFKVTINRDTSGEAFRAERAGTGSYASIDNDGGYATLNLGRTGTGVTGISSSGSSLHLFGAGGAYNNPNMVVNSVGRVGINTTTPNSRLEVAGADSAANGLTINRNTGSQQLRLYTDGVGHHIEADSVGSKDLILDNLEAGRGIRFRTQSQDRMYVSGDEVAVGIGRASASATLDILYPNGQGYCYFDYLNGGSNYFNAVGSSIWRSMTNVNQMVLNHATGNFNLASLAGSGTRMVVAGSTGNLSTQAIPGGGGDTFWGGSLTGDIGNLNTGNVGVGTNTPGRRLQVSGSQGVVTSLISTNVRALIGFQSTNTTGGDNQVVCGALGNEFIIQTSATQRMVVTSGGNVGIGVTAPARSLTVSGTQQIQGSFISAGVTCRMALSDAATTNDSQVGIGSSGNLLQLYAGGGVRATVTNTGRVGIGTTGPSETLDVNGRARIRTMSNRGISDQAVFVNSTGVLTKGSVGDVLQDSGTCNFTTYNDTTQVQTFTGGVWTRTGNQVMISAIYSPTSSNNYNRIYISGPLPAMRAGTKGHGVAGSDTIFDYQPGILDSAFRFYLEKRNSTTVSVGNSSFSISYMTNDA